MDSVNEPPGSIISPTVWRYEPVVNLTHLEAFPQAARERETKKAASTFASTGRNIFVYYVTPILHERRRRLLISGIQKKKYTKTAAQVWQTVSHEENFFWNEAARYVRQCMSEGRLSPKGCLIHGGRLDERSAYVWHAEVAVAAYLELPPLTVKSTEDGDITAIASNPKTEESAAKIDMIEASKGLVECQSTTYASAPPASNEIGIERTELLDTPPDRFEYERKMLYSHFARYEYDAVRAAEGKHQTAMLRQLADLFEKTGKTLFYYYTVPRLCKQSYPSTAGETVTGQAADVWILQTASEKAKWCNASADVKKRLGDGNVGGLEVLELGSLHQEVLKLHELTAAALRSHEGRMKGA